MTATSTSTEFKTWMCLICGYIYDEAAGVPEEGIAPGTRWEDVPINWTCPECGTGPDAKGTCQCGCYGTDENVMRAEAAEAGWNQGIERVEKHLGQWGRGLRLTEDEQRDVHLVALGALLMLCPGGDRERMTRIHRACGCIVCRAEAKAKRERGEGN